MESTPVKWNQEERKKYADILYKLYPKKVGKAAGLKKLVKMLDGQNQFQVVLESIKNYVVVIQRERTQPQYIMMFSTFINGRWEDYTNENLGLGSSPLHLSDLTALQPHGFVKIKK